MTQPLKQAPAVSGAIPIIGFLPQALWNFPELLQERAPKQGDVVRIPIMGTDMYVVSHPEYLQDVFRDDHKKYARGGVGSDMLKRVIGRGLIVLEGEEWLNERRLMQPYFHRRYLPRLIELMAETIDSELDKLEPYVDGETVDMAVVLKRITLAVFLRAMYGLGISDEKTRELSEAIETGMRTNSKRDRLAAFIPHSIKLPMDKVIDENVARFDEIVDEMITARRNSDIEEDDLLGLLMNATDEDGKGMSPEQLHDEVKTLVIGGYDTTSGTLLWSLYLLNQHPDAAQKIAAEATEVIEDALTMETIEQLKYTRMVFDETLRLRPVSWANNRVCVEDDELGGYHIPAGAMIMVPIMHMQRDPRFWDDPEAFKPERWEQPNGGAKHRFAYMPFGLGPRVCLGQHFALLEGTMILAKLYSRYEITPVTDEPDAVSYDFTMHPLKVPVRITRREPVKSTT